MIQNPTNNFKFKNCLFGTTIRVKNSDQEKYVYRGYRVTYIVRVHGVLIMTLLQMLQIFGVDNISSLNADNRKNNFLVLGECPTYGINGSFGSPDKKFSINLTKANTKFCLSL